MLRQKTLFVFLLIFSEVAFSRVLTIFYFDRPPYVYRNKNEVHGILADRLQQIFQSSDIEYRLTASTIQNIIKEIKQPKSYTCALGWFKTSDREIFANFSEPIYKNQKISAFFRAERITDFRKFQTLDTIFRNREVKMGMNPQQQFPEYLLSKIETHGPNIIQIPGSIVNLVKAVNDFDVDYIIVQPEDILAILKYANVSEERFDMMSFSDINEGEKRYLMCSKGVGSNDLSKINQAIQSFDLEEASVPSDEENIEVVS